MEIALVVQGTTTPHTPQAATVATTNATHAALTQYAPAATQQLTFVSLIEPIVSLSQDTTRVIQEWLPNVVTIASNAKNHHSVNNVSSEVSLTIVTLIPVLS